MQEFSALFEGVEDPRCSNATRHSLHEMLMIALLSTLCGGEGCADMERFGRAKEPFLRRFMVLAHGIPSHDAFSDLFNALDPGGLQRVLLRLLEDWSALLEDDVIAIDGKSLRRSFADAAARSPVHLVQAFAARARLVLGQVKVADKSNEIAAMPKLLEMLALKGRIVTADAMHTQRAAAESITARGGDYVLALKGNQASLHDDVRLYLDDPARADELRSCQQVDGDHGRIETRCATVCHEVAWLRERHDWPGLAAIGKIEARRETARRTTTETRYYIMSAPLSPGRFQHAVAHPLGHRKLPALGAGCDHERGSPAQPQRTRTRKPRHAATPRPQHRKARTDKGRHARQAQARRVERRLPPQLDPRRCMKNPKSDCPGCRTRPATGPPAPIPLRPCLSRRAPPGRLQGGRWAPDRASRRHSRGRSRGRRRQRPDRRHVRRKCRA